MDVNGYSNPTLFPRTIESSAVTSPSISGDDNNIYVVYGLGNEVRVKRSTNGGLTWSLWTPTFSLSTNVPEWGLESVISSGKIHVTYLESGIVRYKYRSLTVGGWSSTKEVSNGETGNLPRITIYKNDQIDYVYFIYKKFNSVDYDCRWRRYNVTSDNWDTQIYTAPIVLNGNDVTDNFLGIRADSQNVIIYFEFHEPQPFTYYFTWVILDLYNNRIGYGNADNGIDNYRMYSTPTMDGKTHTAFRYVQLAGEGYSDSGLWRSSDDASYPFDQFYEYEAGEAVFHLNLSSAGNEVHIIWQDQYGNNNGNNLRYIYDDQTPLAPTGLIITEDSNHRPRLNWNSSPEPDKNHYNIYRYDTYGGGWQYLNQTTATTYTDQTLAYCHTVPPAQCENVRSFYYRIIIEARLAGGPPYKIGEVTQETPDEYSLSQNYPNPFNPTTTIDYSIKSAGLVTLKVYDMLGTEVVSLVNELKDAGNYSVTFNASYLPSGIYFYTLTSGNFINTKKLILLK